MKKQIFLLMLSIGIATFLTSCGSREYKKEIPKITVTGSAEMEVVPDEIYMNFTLKEYLDASKKKVKLETVKTEFLQLCKSSGVVDSNISISSYTGNENYDYYWYMRRKREPDFMGTISYIVKVSSTEKLNKIVAGLNEDAIENFYISKTSSSKIEELRKEVKTKALIAGKTKAEYLAKSIGEDVGEALLIQEVDQSYGYDYANENNMKVMEQTTPDETSYKSTSPSFQKIKLRYEMKVEFKLK